MPCCIATYLHDRGADFLFVARGNQKTLSNDIKAFFAAQPPREPDCATRSPQPAHGRIEKLNRNPRLVLDYLRLSQNTRPRAMPAA